MAPGDGHATHTAVAGQAHSCVGAVIAIRRVEAVGIKPQRRGQDRELRGGEGAQRPQRGVGVEPSAHCPHLGDAPGEVLGEQTDDEGQDVVDKTDPAPDPTHRPWKPDRIGAQRIGRRGKARGLLGGGDDRFEHIESPGQPRGQAVGQQAEGGVTLGAVPASDACPARGLARTGAVACQRTSPVRGIRTPLKACIAPRPGRNVLLAGVPRGVSKLHRPWPGGGLARAGQLLSCKRVPRLRPRCSGAKR